MPSRIVSAPSFFVGLASTTCWHREHPEVDFWVRGRPQDSGNGGSTANARRKHVKNSAAVLEHGFGAGRC